MPGADFERIKDHIFGRLERECSPALQFNNASRIRDDILPAAKNLLERIPLRDEEQLIVRTAALCLNLGYIVKYDNNLNFAVEIASHTLREFSYTGRQIKQVTDCIAGAKMTAPVPGLASIVADARHDYLGRDDFAQKAQLIYSERAYYGKIRSEKLWLEQQHWILANHQYATPVAQELRNRGKERNLALVQQELERVKREIPGERPIIAGVPGHRRTGYTAAERAFRDT